MKTKVINRLLKASDVERLYGIARGTLYRLARSRSIPSYRVGAKLTGIRFLPAEVLETLRRPASSK